jgi:AcrR family transcriptional regulator
VAVPSPSPSRRDATREAILAAAVACFSRDGFRRTALDRVAQAAGISRAALYLHFANKEDLFRALVGTLHARTLEEATRAARDPGGLAERVTAVLMAKSGRFFELLRASPHAEEFLDENHRLCGELSADAAAKHTRLLGRMLRAAASAQEIDLGSAGLSAESAAELLLDTAEGIKTRGHATLSPEAYRRRLGDAVRIVLAGLGAGASGAAMPPRRSAQPPSPRGVRSAPRAGRSSTSAKHAMPSAISASSSVPWPTKSAARRGRRR